MATSRCAGDRRTADRRVRLAGFRDLRLAALADAPQAFGSTLGQWRDADERRWRDRIAALALNLVAELDGMPVGMVSGTQPDTQGTVELISMWVAPTARRLGVGAALVTAVIAWAGDAGGRQVVLQVAEGNREATRLCLRHGSSPPARRRHVRTTAFGRCC